MEYLRGLNLGAEVVSSIASARRREFGRIGPSSSEVPGDWASRRAGKYLEGIKAGDKALLGLVRRVYGSGRVWWQVKSVLDVGVWSLVAAWTFAAFPWLTTQIAVASVALLWFLSAWLLVVGKRLRPLRVRGQAGWTKSTAHGEPMKAVSEWSIDSGSEIVGVEAAFCIGGNGLVRDVRSCHIWQLYNRLVEKRRTGCKFERLEVVLDELASVVVVQVVEGVVEVTLSGPCDRGGLLEWECIALLAIGEMSGRGNLGGEKESTKVSCSVAGVALGLEQQTIRNNEEDFMKNGLCWMNCMHWGPKVLYSIYATDVVGLFLTPEEFTHRCGWSIVVRSKLGWCVLTLAGAFVPTGVLNGGVIWHTAIDGTRSAAVSRSEVLKWLTKPMIIGRAQMENWETMESAGEVIWDAGHRQPTPGGLQAGEFELSGQVGVSARC